MHDHPVTAGVLFYTLDPRRVGGTRGAGESAYADMAVLPMGIPGMVLGLGYIFFFNAPGNPLNFIYGTMAILVIATVTHFYTVAHLTALTALKQMDAEFEPVAGSLKQPFYRLFFWVTVPVCLPAIAGAAEPPHVAVARDTRLRLWSEHLQRPVSTITGPAHEVVDTLWRPTLTSPGKHRLTALPGVSRRAGRLQGPLRGLLVDG